MPEFQLFCFERGKGGDNDVDAGVLKRDHLFGQPLATARTRHDIQRSWTLPGNRKQCGNHGWIVGSEAADRMPDRLPGGCAGKDRRIQTRVVA